MSLLYLPVLFLNLLFKFLDLSFVKRLEEGRGGLASGFHI